jgi:hypothetical protein
MLRNQWVIETVAIGGNDISLSISVLYEEKIVKVANC